MSYRRTYYIVKSPTAKCKSKAQLESMLEPLEENMSGGSKSMHHDPHYRGLVMNDTSDLCIICNTLKKRMGKDKDGFSRMGEFCPHDVNEFMIRWSGSADADKGDKIMKSIPGLKLRISEGG